MTDSEKQLKENAEACIVKEQVPTQSPDAFEDPEIAQTLAEPVVSATAHEDLVTEKASVQNSKVEADQQESTVAVSASIQENVITEEGTVQNSKDDVDQQACTVAVSSKTQENVVTEEVRVQNSKCEADQEVSAVVAPVPVREEISEKVEVAVPLEEKLPSEEKIPEDRIEEQATKTVAEAEVVEEMAAPEKPVKEKTVSTNNTHRENETALPSEPVESKSEPVESKSIAMPEENHAAPAAQEKKDLPLQSEPVESKTLATPEDNHAVRAAQKEKDIPLQSETVGGQSLATPKEIHVASAPSQKAVNIPVVVEQSRALPVIVERTAEERETPIPPQESEKAPVTPKKGCDPTKTSVELPASSIPEDSELTEEYWKEHMPEGHTYEKVWKIFYAFDHDLNGTVVMCELADALRCCGLYVSQKEVYKLRLKLGLEHDRVLNFSQFCKFLAIRKKDSIERLTKAFKRFDKDNSGFIDTIELRRCLTSMGEALTRRQVDDMLSGLDINSDGKVDFQEFVDYMTTPSR